MAYKFRKWKIRWQKDKKRFKKIKRDRKKSRDAHVRWRRNRGKMLSALRKSKPRRKLANKKNKARGLYKKLAKARKRWKNILKSDINLDNFDQTLFLSEDSMLDEKMMPTIEIDSSDLQAFIDVLLAIKSNHDWETKEDQDEALEFIHDSIERLKEIRDGAGDDLFEEDEDFLEELVAFIEEYGEETGDIDEVDSDEEEEGEDD